MIDFHLLAVVGEHRTFAAIARPDNPGLFAKSGGHFIIRSAIRWALLLDRQYDIKKWYAIAATPEGKKLVEHLGFENIAGKRDAYLLTDLKKATKPIRAFIDRLEQENEPLVPPPKRK
jgi:hypothetical protein